MKQPDSYLRCDGIRRRDFLHVGLVSTLGLSLADWFRLTAKASPDSHRPKSCILIWLDGGPSHIDTFDPKPDAPKEVRGPFSTIHTAADGIQLSELMPNTAKVMQHVALIRSLTHELGNHDTGSHYLLTGHRPTPVLDFPSLGSVVARESQQAKALPPYVAIPNAVNSMRSGYLPGATNPFSIGGDPSRSGFQVRDLVPPEWMSFDQVQSRLEMRKALEQLSDLPERSADETALDQYFAQAHQLITSDSARAAFDLNQETQETRNRYGRRRIGSGCLLARRLVEAGSRFVTVVDRGWDTHQDVHRTLPDAQFPGSGKVPDMDRAFASLVEDLNDRGMLESTLVVMMGEFGRTPKLNSRAGRDHWPRAGFVCMAGAGVRGGQVIGETDEYGEIPVTQPVRPEDVAYSIYSLLGIDPEKEYKTPSGRPMKIMGEGSWIEGLT